MMLCEEGLESVLLKEKMRKKINSSQNLKTDSSTSFFFKFKVQTSYLVKRVKDDERSKESDRTNDQAYLLVQRNRISRDI